VTYDKSFFDLQLRFAARAAQLAGVPFEQALLDRTNLYVRLVGDRRFDAGHPLWITYLEGLRRSADASDWTWRFYLQRPDRGQPPEVVATFGCFCYALTDEAHRVKLHFQHAQRDGDSPLSAACAPQRIRELHMLVEDVAARLGADARIAGLSWLYNLPAYRRLFPTAYVENAQAVEGKFRNMPLWGQFIDFRGRLKPQRVEAFEQRLAALDDVAQLGSCFPLQPLAVEAPLDVFAQFYRQRDRDRSDR
jgi:hypothetical protein